tara:strand:+ start:199 stop:963 length:765 start_codon:yes stop_codon:yes gene_type:complete
MKTVPLAISVFILISGCYFEKIRPANLYPDLSKPIKNQEQWQIDSYKERISKFVENPIGFNKIVFLGNSITSGAGDWNIRFGLKDLIINRGIGGDITGGVLARLNEILYYKPRAVFLLIGLNDIFNGDIPEIDDDISYVAKNIIKIASRIKKHSPKTKIFIQTILPVNKNQFESVRGFYPNHKMPVNDKINQINLKLYEFNSENGYTIIDLNSIFLNEKEEMDEKFSTDGVHLNDSGYELWTNHIKQYLIELTQ